jgi:leucyl aminopeptidase
MIWSNTAHVFAWRPTAKPGRPKGGEAYALRACYAVLKARYSRG